MNFAESQRRRPSSMPLFTVFTATYNRAHTIHRVFDSLCAQTLRDFEWLVVDDGSTDNTSEVIATWAKRADFAIRYFKQVHSGKHIAHNLAAREAHGRFFLTLDSDDACVPEALERMAFHWNAIPAHDRARFAGVVGLCCDQHGRIIGDRFPTDPFDASLRERRYVYRIRGEKWGSTLTDVVRQFPFPVIRGTQFIPEGVIGLEIGKAYKSRCVNEIFRIYYVNDNQTGATLTRRRRLPENAPGRLHYYVWLLNNDLEYFFHLPIPFLKAAVMIPIAARDVRQHFALTMKSLQKWPAKLLILLALPISSAIYLFDRMWREGG
jgi:glycosyltransferase involved in cell wall biosynthesis